MIPSLSRVLSDQLSADIQKIQPQAEGATARRALRRLQAVAEHFPAFLLLLAEPWIEEAISGHTQAVLVHCARIHLYARILDDALDENLPIYRHNLLRAQTLLWQSAQALCSGEAGLDAEALRLIGDTVNAVQSDDKQRSPAHWGAKNHHLLLAPLLLSGHSQAYQCCRPGLSTLIALVQAGDEWRQGEMLADEVRGEFLSRVPDMLEAESLASLRTHGWPGAAERIVWETRQLLNMLQS